MAKANKLMKMVSPYLTVGFVYILVDVICDFGLVALPAPCGYFLYFARYGAVVTYGIIKLYRKRTRSVNGCASCQQLRNKHGKPQTSPLSRLGKRRGGKGK